MIIDSSLEFSDKQPLSATSQDSTDTIDLGDRTVLSVPLTLALSFPVAASKTGAVSIVVNGSDDNSTFTPIMTISLAQDDITEGKRINYLLPHELPQYLKLTYKPTTAEAECLVNAALVLVSDTPKDKKLFDAVN